jgi:DNA-binding HxlR family transcriptional regulator
MADVQALRLWIDHAKFGCGQREFIAVVGRKWVTLIAVGSAAHARITKADFEAAAQRGSPIARRTIKRQLKRNALVFGHADGGVVKDALRRL